MALIDKETIRAEIERLEEMDYQCDTFEQSEGFYDALGRVKSFLDTLPDQPVDGLEKEIHDYMFRLGESDSSAGILRDKPGYMRIVEKVARHFAEWGRKQVLQEIYDGKVKPVDKITAAWLVDEQNT